MRQYESIELNQIFLLRLMFAIYQFCLPFINFVYHLSTLPTVLHNNEIYFRVLWYIKFPKA